MWAVICAFAPSRSSRSSGLSSDDEHKHINQYLVRAIQSSQISHAFLFLSLHLWDANRWWRRLCFALSFPEKPVQS
jgi:hypothetical protein